MSSLTWLIFSFFLGLHTAPQQGEVPQLGRLSFMSGCWIGEAGEGTMIEEHYTTPSENLMLGTTRYLSGGRTISFELTTIRRDSTGVSLTPYPNGTASDAFRLTRLDDRTAVFENPEHDFPQRITYRQAAEDSLAARVENPGGRVMEWQMTRARCDSN
jgi:hypothetical protein